MYGLDGCWAHLNRTISDAGLSFLSRPARHGPDTVPTEVNNVTVNCTGYGADRLWAGNGPLAMEN